MIKINRKLIPDKLNLVAEKTLETDSTEFEITGLDIIRDGGIYDIVIEEFSKIASSSGHVLTINDINPGTDYTSNNITAISGNTTSFMAHNGLCYVNGWNQGTKIFFVVGTIIMYNLDWISFTGTTTSIGITPDDGVFVTAGSCIIGKSIPNITKLKIVSLDGSSIAAGSIIKVYKR